MIEIRIDPSIQALLPKLSESEKALLEASLKAEGCREPLIHCRGRLLDGHHRYEICTRLGIHFELEEVDLPDRISAETWVLKTQLGRRNLSKGQQAMRLAQWIEKKTESKNSVHATAVMLIEQTGVLISKTVLMDALWAHRSQNPPLVDGVLAGQVNTKQARDLAKHANPAEIENALKSTEGLKDLEKTISNSRKGTRASLRFRVAEVLGLSPSASGDEIKIARQKKGLTQSQVAHRAGTRQDAVSEIERNPSRVNEVGGALLRDLRAKSSIEEFAARIGKSTRWVVLREKGEIAIKVSEMVEVASSMGKTIIIQDGRFRLGEPESTAEKYRELVALFSPNEALTHQEAVTKLRRILDESQALDRIIARAYGRARSSEEARA